MHQESLWQAQKRTNPGHSAWYIQRFEQMRADGADLDGEARLLDAMAPRGSRILDAGCGPGRVGGEMSRRGHTVVGVDADFELIAAARKDFPDVLWLVEDLADLDLPAAGIAEPFDVIVCAGNVLTFLAPETAPAVLRNFARHLGLGGRVVTGFGAGRGYAFEDFLIDAKESGLSCQSRFATWDLKPWTPSADFMVTILSRD
ncbi:class I SAM-dependent methyltransferase [Paeniglutamicibacter antarcticus]|uniref:Class I SAM-dependent methyltransferase n=1 Tax=Arthrobacter terrae TaxID=2935737 RepID=A0A931CN03_9MICC|nr:class I SAM-dependent methyltransferase [Arthrobacter terrae]MBG0741228.1 class I SAM-dependent methyltransferase [Arthrobacter terrae]